MAGSKASYLESQVFLPKIPLELSAVPPAESNAVSHEVQPNWFDMQMTSLEEAVTYLQRYGLNDDARLRALIQRLKENRHHLSAQDFATWCRIKLALRKLCNSAEWTAEDRNYLKTWRWGGLVFSSYQQYDMPTLDNTTWLRLSSMVGEGPVQQPTDGRHEAERRRVFLLAGELPPESEHRL